jgi:hypothetical protein
LGWREIGLVKSVKSHRYRPRAHSIPDFSANVTPAMCPEQERRAQQAALRADEILSASSSQMREAERAPREAVYKAEMLKWRIERGGLRPRLPRFLAGRRWAYAWHTEVLGCSTPRSFFLPLFTQPWGKGCSPKLGYVLTPVRLLVLAVPLLLPSSGSQASRT